MQRFSAIDRKLVVVSSLKPQASRQRHLLGLPLALASEPFPIPSEAHYFDGGYEGVHSPFNPIAFVKKDKSLATLPKCITIARSSPPWLGQEPIWEILLVIPRSMA
jgi:hypothetical protein